MKLISKPASAFCFSYLAILVALISQTVAAKPGDDKVRNAREVIINRMTSALPIPTIVSDQAKCIASVKVVKVGVIWGGEGSTGLLSCRTADGTWSAPSFFNVGGANFGAQVGVQTVETVLLFMTAAAKQVVLQPSFEVGTQVSIAAGPVGADVVAGQIPNVAVLSYQKTAGLYAGSSVSALSLKHIRRLNAMLYGRELLPSDIVAIPGAKAPASVQPYLQTMNQYWPNH